MPLIHRFAGILCLTLLAGVTGGLAAPLHDATKAGDQPKIQALLAEGADINAPDEDGYLPLHRAVESAKPDMVRLLLTLGAEVDGKGVHSGAMTPLHFAAYSGLTDIAELLLDEGADINARSAGGLTPLFYAVNNRRKDMVRLLVSKGADIFVQDRDGATVLHESAGYSGSDRTEYLRDFIIPLLSSDAGVDGRDRNGCTALHKAAFYGRTKIAELLLARGADANATDNDGDTPLFNSTTNDGVADVFRLLLGRGAIANIRNTTGLTPLHEAAASGTTEIIELLLAHGAGLDTRNNDGRTPLDYAALWSARENFVLLHTKLSQRPLSAEAESAIGQGIAAAKEADFLSAIRFFETARTEAPYSALPLYYLGLAESKVTGRELRALCWFKAFLARSPDSPMADGISLEIARLEQRSRDLLFNLLKVVTDAVDLLPPPDASEPQDPEGSSWDSKRKSVALLWARAGEGDAAMQQAGRIINPFLRTVTAIEIAGLVALAGDPERGKRVMATAVSSADQLERNDDRANALTRAAAALANLGDRQGANIIAARIDDAEFRCQALLAIVKAEALLGHGDAAMAAAETIPVRFYRSAAQAFIARVAAETGDRTTAAQMLVQARSSLAGVVYDVNQVYRYGPPVEAVRASSGYYNLEALRRGVMMMEYRPRPLPARPRSVQETDRQSFDISALTLDCFIAEGLIQEVDKNAAENYAMSFSAKALRDLCSARARTGDLKGAKAILDLAVSSERYRMMIGSDLQTEMRVGIAHGTNLAGDRESARMQLVAARSLAPLGSRRVVAEAADGWIAANEYLLSDIVFTDLPEHLRSIPRSHVWQAFSALADTAITLADAQMKIFSMRQPPLLRD